MRVRLTKEGRISWEDFAERFVGGGLPVSKGTRIQNANLYKGIPRKDRRDEPTYKKGTKKWATKFQYRLCRPLKNTLNLAAAPPLLKGESLQVQPDTHGRWWLQQIKETTLYLGWPDQIALRKLFYWFHGPTNKAKLESRESFLGTKLVNLGIRSQDAFLQWSYSVAQNTQEGGYRGRYPSGYALTVKNDFVRQWWSWLKRQGSSPLSFRHGLFEKYTTSLDQLSYRLKRVNRQQRERQRYRLQVKRLSRYRGYVLFRPKKKLLKSLRRFFRFRRKTLRPYLTEGYKAKKAYKWVTRRFFQQRKINRAGWIEIIQSTKPEESYLFFYYRWVVSFLYRRVSNVWDYTYLKKDSRYTYFVNRRTTRSRRWRIKDHPKLKGAFLIHRQQRWDWFFSGVVGTLLNKYNLSEDKKDVIYDASQPPLVSGLFSSVYWGLQLWGRGSRWRTKPSTRALMVFIQTLKGGLSKEHDALQWSQAATSSTGVLLSCTVENEVTQPYKVDEKISQTTAPQTNQVSFELPQRVSKSKKRWWAFFTVWWQVYRFVCWGWLFFFFCFRWTHWALVHWGSVPFIFIISFVNEIIKKPLHWFKSLTRNNQLFKSVRVTYIAWLIAYSSDDDHRDLETYEPDEDERGNGEEDEEDPTGENWADLHEHPADPLKEGPIFPWQNWWHKEIDSFYDEGMEVAQEIILEEIPFWVKLAYSPVIDFFCRLPFWSFRDGAARRVLAFKKDWQTRWYRLLVYGNHPGKIRGRWWKFPLLFCRFAFHVARVITLTAGLRSTLSYSTLKLWVTYSRGFPFQDEYYLRWLFFCFFLVRYLIGPCSLKSYFFEELGVSNLVFLFAGTTTLGSPEEYYPHRSAPVIRSALIEKTLGPYHKDTFVAFRGDRAGTTVWPYGRMDPHRVVPAQFIGYNDYPWESDFDDNPAGLQLVWPHREEFEEEKDFENLHERFPGDERRWGHNITERHPTLRRNNLYDVEFLPDALGTGGRWPEPYTLDLPRNEQLIHTADQSQSAANLVN